MDRKDNARARKESLRHGDLGGRLLRRIIEIRAVTIRVLRKAVVKAATVADPAIDLNSTLTRTGLNDPDRPPQERRPW